MLKHRLWSSCPVGRRQRWPTLPSTSIFSADIMGADSKHQLWSMKQCWLTRITDNTGSAPASPTADHALRCLPRDPCGCGLRALWWPFWKHGLAVLDQRSEPVMPEEGKSVQAARPPPLPWCSSCVQGGVPCSLPHIDDASILAWLIIDLFPLKILERGGLHQPRTNCSSLA